MSHKCDGDCDCRCDHCINFHKAEIVENKCSWCGITDSQNRFDTGGPLTEIRVQMARGEEGDGTAIRWACDSHVIQQTYALEALGYGIHYHGGICYLEQFDCPGVSAPDRCPTPEERYEYPM